MNFVDLTLGKRSSAERERQILPERTRHCPIAQKAIFVKFISFDSPSSHQVENNQNFSKIEKNSTFFSLN